MSYYKNNIWVLLEAAYQLFSDNPQRRHFFKIQTSPTLHKLFEAYVWNIFNVIHLCVGIFLPK